jgi:hypothetical protein
MGPPHTTRRRVRSGARLIAALLVTTVVTTLVAGCGRGGDASSAATAAPASAGQVWEADRAEDRANAPATMLAFVNGLHVVVLDGNDAYAGMTRLRVAPAADGKRAIPLSNGLGAEIVPVGEVMELRFSSGETLPLRRQPERTGR